MDRVVGQGRSEWTGSQPTIIAETFRFYNDILILNSFKPRKSATVRGGLPCQRHNRYFNNATVGNGIEPVACHPKRCMLKCWTRLDRVVVSGQGRKTGS